MIIIKRIISCVLAFSVVLSCFNSCKSNKIPLVIFDNLGNELANISKISDLENTANPAYTDIVLDEAIEILCDINKTDTESAEKLLLEEGYSVYTYYDREVNEAVASSANSLKGTSIGAAVTDINGNLLAAYSSSFDEELNYSTKLTIPCSSFKPLSVYSQAIESGKACWSTVYEDSPYKKIKNDKGESVNWPANSDGKYSYSKVTVADAIKKSLNTVAVRCIRDVGVKKSVEFINMNFKIPLTYEKQTMLTSGEDEIIGNVGLGYISSGVSPVDMAGYYQIFANGGYYLKPKAIAKIVDANGNEVYIRKEADKDPIISAETSDIMNKLLQGVVSKTGTGLDARVDGVEIAGKTGTDENFTNHWFVGVTPEHSIAFWHSASEKVKNNAPSLFSDTVKEIYSNNKELKTKFLMHSNLKAVIYCKETGKIASLTCKSIDKGYFGKNMPGTCSGH